MTITIGDASRETGLSVKMIRYYEEIGLLSPVARTAAGYRTYRTSDLQRLRFIRQARELHFAMPELRSLLALWDDNARDKAHVRHVATTHIASMRRHITDLETMVATLQKLVDSCATSEQEDCPILTALDGAEPPRSS